MDCLYIPMDTAVNIFMTAGFLFFLSFITALMGVPRKLGIPSELVLVFTLINLGMFLFFWFVTGVANPTAADFSACSEIIAPFGY